MAKTDFLKTWDVVHVMQMTDVLIGAMFTIEAVPGVDDKVTIKYASGFSGYPSGHEGDYDSGADRVSAQFQDGHWITLEFAGGSTPNYDRLAVSVSATTAGLAGPEVGEFEAEAG